MRTVPRYTSYPTAPHFHTGVTGDLYAAWLKDLTQDDSLSLYLHVPYCREICHYCGCLTKATRQDAPLTAYAKTLGEEIELVAGHLTASGPVKHIHWGGGTPSLLPRESLAQLTGMIKERFVLAPDLEHAIELDPRHVSAALSETLASIGVNRASLGIQDLDLSVQKAIGRVQPFHVVEAAVQYLRDAGLFNINFDLMYGLPEQTVETIRSTIAQSVALKPGRIALFGYAHVPWMKKHQKLIDEASLPDAAKRLELASVAREDLLRAGYQPIGLDHFALPDDSMAIRLRDGSLKRNFQGYTTDQGGQMIGFGVSSIGRLTKGYVQNISDVGNWRRAVESKQFPIARGIALSSDDLMRGLIIEQLMTDYSCDLAEASALFDMPVETLQPSVMALEDLKINGVVEIDDWTVNVLPAGRPYVRLAAAAFDAYLDQKGTSQGARHSMAV